MIPQRLVAFCGLVLALLGLGTPSPSRAQTTAPEIVELARALKGDPDLIYEYVYNNIRTLPIHGSLKGALGALLDQQGTSFDQAELMVLLLRQSGYTANFAIGSVHLPATEAANWLGTDTGPNSTVFTMFYGGFTYGYALLPGGDLDDIHFNWAWVQATIPGSPCGGGCVFDPATKFGMGTSGYTRATGMGLSAIGSALGYNQSSFLSNAAAVTTTSPWSLTSLNRTGVRDNLAGYATNLVQYLRTNNPAASTADVIGGTTGIAPLPLGTQYRSGGVPRQFAAAFSVFSDIPPQYRTKLTQQFGSNNAGGTFTSLSSPVTLNTADIYGHRMTVAFSGASVPRLLLDGVTQVTASGAAPAGLNLTVRVTISFPFPAVFGDWPGVTNDDNTRIVPVANGAHALTSSWGPIGRGMIERHRRQLQQNMAANPGNPNAEPVLGESLSIIGYTYAAQYAQHAVIIGQLSGTLPVNYYFYGGFGIATHGSVTGPGISIWARAQNYIQLAGRSAAAHTPAEGNAYFAEGLIASVTESATLEQTQPGILAVSTTKLVDIAVQNGTHIFDINNAAIPGNTAAYYSSTIRPNMAGNSWSSGDLSGVDRNVTRGDRIIAPQSGVIAVNQYRGTGWFDIAQGSGFDNIGGTISGNLFGGNPANPVTPAETNDNVEGSLTVASNSNTVSLLIESQGDAGGIVGATDSSYDPVNLVTGDSYLSTTDLTVGSGGMPVGLAFQRYYDSGTRLTTGPLGYGWTHNFAITALANSDPYEGLGVNSAINGAAAIAATFVVVDIANTGVVVGRPIDRFVIGSVAYRWLTDNLTGNVVAVKQPGYIEHFTKLADGTYNPPPGSGATLSLDGGAYTYVAKDRTTLAFNTDGTLASWASPAGAAMALSYSGSPSLLSTVTNNLGRSLTLAYQSGQLTQVTDDSGRSIAFGYDGVGNLASFVDPLGQATSYVYDLPGRMTQIYYPATPGTAFVTNSYDSLGRVQAQTNILGGTWLYYLAGARSEEVDPFGMRHVYYNTPRGKTRTEILDLQGPGQTVTTIAYDALDRVTLATAPEGNSTAYTYDLKSNVLSVTRTPKPGSLLSPLVTTTIYDSFYNKPLTVTDPRGLVTAMTYDPFTGNLVSAVADSANLKATTRYTYNGVGLPLTVTDPVGTVTQNTYDPLGNLASTIRDSGAGRLNLTTAYTYNPRGDPLTVTDPRGNVTTNTYDDARRPLTTTTPATAAAPAGIVTSYSYDPAGRVLQTQQSAAGSILRTTSATYTPSGKPATATDPNGNTMRYAYDLLDRQIKTTDPLGRVMNYAYDTLGRPTRVSNPAISASPLVQQSFTLNSVRASLTDANGNATAFTYDGFDRLTTTAYPGGSTETAAYDADSNVVSRTTRAGQPIAYAYDTLNRLTTKTPPSPAPVVSYSYDLAGRLKSTSDTSAAITSAVSPTGAPVAYTTAFTYDALNRPTGTTWDPAPTATAPGAASSVLFTHSYNKANQRNGQSVSDNTWINYPAAAASTTVYTPNNLNQYTAVGGVSATYSTNGNLTSDGTYNFVYDAENRLTNASGAGNTASYTFDAQGRRKTRTVNGTTTVSVTDAQNREVLEYNGSTGALLRWYAYSLGPNAVLGQMNIPANTRTTPVPDLLGSIVSSMDASTGTLAKFTYRPYGASAAAPTPFGYTGQRVDQESGLYYYRARHYSPAWGRFLQPDPVGYSAGANLYGYVRNDPLNAVDPSGNCPWCIAAGIGAIVSAGIDLGVQLYSNGGNLDQVNWTSVGVSALAGAAFSGLGPSGFLLGRGGTQAALRGGYDQAPGLLNQGTTRFGWSYNSQINAEVLSLRVGRSHFDVPGTAITAGQNAIRDGLVFGTVAGTLLAPGSASGSESSPFSAPAFSTAQEPLSGFHGAFRRALIPLSVSPRPSSIF